MKIKKILKDKKGFTLLEILVVIFIIGMLSTILVANWRRGEEQYKIRNMAQQVAQKVRKTQELALNTFKETEKDIPKYYGIFFDKQESIYGFSIFADENGNGKYDDPGDIIEAVYLDSGIEIDALSKQPRLHIMFSVPDGFVSFVPTNDEAWIRIKKEGGICPGDCVTITISGSGQVDVE